MIVSDTNLNSDALPPISPGEMNRLTDQEIARALHRTVRAMHDGNCPECGHLGPADAFAGYCRVEVDENDKEIAVIEKHTCPVCGFTITAEEAQEALQEFQKYMAVNCQIFKRWRLKREARRELKAQFDKDIEQTKPL